MSKQLDRPDWKRKADLEDQFLHDMDAVRRSYKIIRMFVDVDKGDQVIKRGLPLVEAQAHCRRSDTHGDGWFDGYEGE